MREIILPHHGVTPRIHESVFVAPGVAIIGDVEIAADASIWFGSILRGDVNYIRIGERTNIQDGTVVHVSSETHATVVGSDVTVGHRVTLHGCTVEDNCLIGIGAILLDGVHIGRDSFVAAGTLLTPGTVIPPGSMVMGAPGSVRRPLRPDEIDAIRRRAAHYVELAAGYRDRRG